MRLLLLGLLLHGSQASGCMRRLPRPFVITGEAVEGPAPQPPESVEVRVYRATLEELNSCGDAAWMTLTPTPLDPALGYGFDVVEGEGPFEVGPPLPGDTWRVSWSERAVRPMSFTLAVWTVDRSGRRSAVRTLQIEDLGVVRRDPVVGVELMWLAFLAASAGFALTWHAGRATAEARRLR